LLRDAKLRQGIFFQKLGLTDLDPIVVPQSPPSEAIVVLEFSEMQELSGTADAANGALLP
jgi:hypothetical protein